MKVAMKHQLTFLLLFRKDSLRLDVSFRAVLMDTVLQPSVSPRNALVVKVRNQVCFVSCKIENLRPLCLHLTNFLCLFFIWKKKANGQARPQSYCESDCIDTATDTAQFHETVEISGLTGWPEIFVCWPDTLVSSVQADYESPQAG